ncbi:hypothetical protein F5882DRAFT_522700 [Hyaloscypha sp. PMI_1271]|nr:hypothetical protein F5882DRAFT_522700 [Hyaloscypha sp. PMI_1271]
MASQESPQDTTYRALIYSLKHHPEGIVSLGSDGVLRSFSGPLERHVVDAIGFSPSQIKNFLDTTEPWSQEREDQLRGVDGRKVTTRDALFTPPEDSKPQVYTEESLKKRMEEIERLNKELFEGIEREREIGVDVAAKYACGRKRSDFDLSPRGESKEEV